jgi:hypothetical protein
MLASVVINRAQKTLLDETEVLWSETELLDYINAGISAIVAVKPDEYVVTESFTLTNAQTKQTIPTGARYLLEITRNLSPSVKAITQVERNHLNHANEDWAATAGVPRHFMYDGDRNPNIFYIYPQPASGTNTVEMVYAGTPTRLTAVSDTIPIDDVFENPLYFFTLAMAYAKNAKRGDLSKTSNYLSLFANAIGAQGQVEVNFTPGTPNETPAGVGQKQGPTV